jgi:hypothetical protein
VQLRRHPALRPPHFRVAHSATGPSAPPNRAFRVRRPGNVRGDRCGVVGSSPLVDRRGIVPCGVVVVVEGTTLSLCRRAGRSFRRLLLLLLVAPIRILVDRHALARRRRWNGTIERGMRRQ